MNMRMQMSESLKRPAVVYGSIALITGLLILLIETYERIPKICIVLTPFFLATALLLTYSLLNADSNILKKRSPLKVLIIVLFFLISFALTCTPAIGLGNLHSHPFHDFRWLVVSLLGIIFSLALLNYCLDCPNNYFNRITEACVKLWHMPERWFVLVFFVLMFITANLISLGIFKHIPHVQDSIAQLFQAKIFALGKITVPSPPIIEFFQYFYDNIVASERWYSQYPPGHSALLMLGVLAGTPWFINPLLAALSVIMLFKTMREWSGEKHARVSIGLFSISPFILFMSASFMNHVSTLLFILLYLYSLIKAQKTSSNTYAIIAGLSLGMVLNIRPLEAVALGTFFGGCFFIWNLQHRTFRTFLSFVCAFCFMALLLLAYNYATTGDPLLFGYQVRWGNAHTLGFSSISVMDRLPHTPYRGVINSLRSSIALNQNLFEWLFPSLLPIIIFFTPFLYKKTLKDYLALGGMLIVPLFYFFYFYQDLCLGPRFLYASLPCILFLSARSFDKIISGIATARCCSLASARNAFITVILFSIIFALFIRMPYYSRYYANTFWEVDNRYMQKAKEMKIDNALIFMEAYGDRDTGLGSGFLYNSPELNSPIIFAKNLGERNIELIHFFPDRRYYLASRDTEGTIDIQPLKITAHNKKNTNNLDGN